MIDRRARTAILVLGLLFCLVFGAMTLSVTLNYGFDIFTLTAFVMLGLIVAGLIGAIRHPPDE